jgi:ArsR family transcriptional regulator
MKAKKALKILSALSQETRLAIFRLLIQEGEEGLSAGVISEVLQVPPATLSFHLAQLSDAGILKFHKNGRSVMYVAKYKTMKNLMEYMTENSYKKRLKEERKRLADEKSES